MLLARTPQFIQALLPALTWRIPTDAPALYLTFDDGPIPEVTPWVLDELQKHRAKATFFCVGQNAERHPDVFQRIVNEGHSIGNHTFNHLNGWKTPTRPYLHNVRQCARAVHSHLFRPPYGALRLQQGLFLLKHYKIVMWDVLSGDFNPKLSGEQCLQNVLKNARRGSIVVFHDSLKAEKRLRHALPHVLDYYGEKGWKFERIM